MKNNWPFLLLIPIILLLAWLPRTVHSDGAYPLSPTSHALSIVVWSLAFCVILGLNRRAGFTRPFVALLALAGAARCLYRFSAAEIGLAHFILVMAGGFLVVAYAFILAPPFRRKIQDETKPPA
jgi:hypothetical protein